MRIHTQGVVTLAQAEALGALLAAGAKYHRQLALTITGKDTEYTAEARKYLPTLKHQYLRLAVVVQSPIVRAAINLMIRFTGDASDLSMFRSEPEALAWLDDIR